MTGSFILDYYVLVILAASGVFQAIAAVQGFRGLLFFKYRPSSFLLGLAMLVGSFTWFFISEPRNVSDNAHGLNGNEQFAYFFAGSGTGLAVTLALSSLRNWGLRAGNSTLPAGLDALRDISYVGALRRTACKLMSGTEPRAGASSGRSIFERWVTLDKVPEIFELGRKCGAAVNGGARRLRYVRQWMRSWV